MGDTRRRLVGVRGGRRTTNGEMCVTPLPHEGWCRGGVRTSRAAHRLKGCTCTQASMSLDFHTCPQRNANSDRLSSGTVASTHHKRDTSVRCTVPQNWGRGRQRCQRRQAHTSRCSMQRRTLRSAAPTLALLVPATLGAAD